MDISNIPSRLIPFSRKPALWPFSLLDVRNQFVKWRHQEWIRNFRRKIPLSISSNRYTVATVETRDQLLSVLKLRHRIFYTELLGKSNELGLDIDEYDAFFDHLIVTDNRNGQVVGTYRLQSSSFSKSFYSDTEFVLDSFKSTPGTKVELGRACIDSNHRNGAVLALLWKGIFQYVNLTEAHCVFGCSSLSITDAFTAALLSRYLREGGVVLSDDAIRPRPHARFKDFPKSMDAAEKHDALGLLKMQTFIPPLLQSYFRSGARVAREPAWDKKFRCTDFFTLLETSMMRKSIEKKINQ